MSFELLQNLDLSILFLDDIDALDGNYLVGFQHLSLVDNAERTLTKHTLSTVCPRLCQSDIVGIDNIPFD